MKIYLAWVKICQKVLGGYTLLTRTVRRAALKDEGKTEDLPIRAV